MLPVGGAAGLGEGRNSSSHLLPEQNHSELWGRTHLSVEVI